VIKFYDRDAVPAELLGGQQPPMSSDYVLAVIDKNGNIETECLNAPGDLVYLLVAMDSRVLLETW
jgi:hypothetical protein